MPLPCRSASFAQGASAEAGDGPTDLHFRRVFEKLIGETYQIFMSRIVRGRQTSGSPVRLRQLDHLPKGNFQANQIPVIGLHVSRTPHAALNG